MSNRVEFISYDGAYPNYCGGTFVLRIDGATIQMPEHSIRMNCGNIWKERGGEGWKEGFEFPEFLAPIKNEILKCINDNVRCCHCHGCD